MNEEMNELADLKEELRQYIALASRQHDENKALRAKIQESEGELIDTKQQLQEALEDQRLLTEGTGDMMHRSIFEKAKSEWKKQAIEYGEKQCELAYGEFDAEIKKYYSILALDQAENQADEWPLCGQLLTRYILNEAHYIAERKVYKSLYRAYSANTLQVMDFDIEDRHIKIQNNSKFEIKLKNYIIYFHESEVKISFDSGSILSGQYVSIWWGNQPAWRHCPERGSIVVDIGRITMQDFERAELFSSKSKPSGPSTSSSSATTNSNSNSNSNANANASAFKPGLGITIVYANQYCLFQEDDNEFSSLDTKSHPHDTKAPASNVSSPKRGGKKPTAASPKKASADAHAAGPSASSSGEYFSEKSNLINISKYLKKKAFPYFLDYPKPLLMERKAGCLEMSTQYIPPQVYTVPSISRAADQSSSHSASPNSRKRSNNGFPRSNESRSPTRSNINLNEQFSEHEMITTTIDEVFRITIRNYSKRRVPLDNYHIRVFSSKVREYALPRGLFIDASSEMTLTSCPTDEESNSRRCASKTHNTSSARSSISDAVANEIYMPELHNIFSINFPPRSVHLVSDLGLHVCECIESAVLRGVFPAKKIASDNRFAEEVFELAKESELADKPSKCTLM